MHQVIQLKKPSGSNNNILVSNQNMSRSQSGKDSSSSDQEMLDIVDQPSYQASLKDASMKSVSIKSRGPKKIPPQWSRVIDIEDLGDDEHVGHVIAPDMEAILEGLKQIRKRSRKEWHPLFHPKHWWRDHPQHDLQEHLLNREELSVQGRRVVELRKLFWFRTAKLVDGADGVLVQGVEEAKRLSKKLESRGSFGHDGFKAKAKD